MDPVTTTWIAALAVIFTIFALRAALFIGAGFALSHATGFGRRRRIYRVAFAPGQLVSEATAGIMALAFDALVIATLYHWGVIAFADTNELWRVAATFLILSLWIEIWFYLSHRVMHDRRFYWMHRQHHTAKVTNPITSLSFSIAERAVIILGVAAFAVLLGQVFALSLTGFVLVLWANYVLNVFFHANVEFVPDWIARSWFGRMFITPSFHAMHHARFRGNYGLYTRLLDRWFGTEFADVDWVYDEARSGRGLPHFGAHRKD